MLLKGCCYKFSVGVNLIELFNCMMDVMYRIKDLFVNGVFVSCN